MIIKFRRNKDLRVTATEFLTCITDGKIEKDGYTITPEKAEDDSGVWYSLLANGHGQTVTTLNEYSEEEIITAARKEVGKTVSIIYRCTPGEKAAMSDFCEEHGIKLSELLRDAVKEYLNKVHK